MAAGKPSVTPMRSETSIAERLIGAPRCASCTGRLVRSVAAFSVARMRTQLCSERARSPPGSFGVPEPQESDAGQPSFLGAGTRPFGDARGIKLATVKLTLTNAPPPPTAQVSKSKGAPAAELALEIDGHGGCRVRLYTASGKNPPSFRLAGRPALSQVIEAQRFSSAQIANITLAPCRLANRVRPSGLKQAPAHSLPVCPG